MCIVCGSRNTYCFKNSNYNIKLYYYISHVLELLVYILYCTFLRKYTNRLGEFNDIYQGM